MIIWQQIGYVYSWHLPKSVEGEPKPRFPNETLVINIKFEDCKKESE